MSFDPTTPATHGPDLDITLFERYCTGEATPEQLAEIEAWIASHPEEGARYIQMRAGLREGDAPEVTDAQQEMRLAAIMHHARDIDGISTITHQSKTAVKSPEPHPRVLEDNGRAGNIAVITGRYTRWAVYTGIAVALVITGWIGGTRRSLLSADTKGVSTYTTSNGQRATITLSDGTIVSLNVGSRLEVPVQYGSHNRIVRLKGEALFTVVSSKGSPFTVATSKTIVRVLGTTFRVQEYDLDTSAIVAVRDGKVNVSSSTGMSTVLTAMQEAVVTTKNGLQVRNADVSNFAFAVGLLTFNGTNLREAIPVLNRWYNVEIHLADPALAMQRIKGSFVSGSPTDLNAILEWTYGVRVVQNGRVLTLWPR